MEQMSVDPPTDENDVISDDESLEDKEDAESQLKLQELDEMIKSSPYNYQPHVDRISLLRKMAEFETLRTARQEMSALFPLTPELWLQWLEDEQKFAEGDEDHKKLEELFELAVKDYMSPELWLEYAQYSIRLTGEQEGISKLRSRMERALSSVGLHVTKGVSIWEAYREIENVILMTIQPAPGSITTAEQNDQILAQVTRVGSLFTRQLAIPLRGMETTMVEYKEWHDTYEDGEISAILQQTYDDCKTELEPLLKLESELETAEGTKREIYQRYIELEMKSEDPSRVQCIYERAIADNCLDAELWLQYIKYLSDTVKHGPVMLSVVERSVRNCPWTSQLWQRYLECLERCNESQDKIEEVEKDAFAAGFASAGDYARLWQACCDQRRRRVAGCTDADKASAIESLRAIFVKATTHLLNNVLAGFGETGDPDYTLWTYWARCEARLHDDVTRARKVIDDVMKDSEARRNWKIWLEYFQLEMRFGDVTHARSVLRQAAQHSAADDGSAELACATLLQFEREHGSLSELDEAQRRTEGRLAKVAKRKERFATQHQNRGPNKRSNEQRGQGKGQGQGGKKWKQQTQKKRTPEKRGRNSVDNDAVPIKRQKQENEESTTKNDVDGFKAPAGLPVRFVKAKAKPEGEESSAPKAKITPPPGFRPDPSPKDDADKAAPQTNIPDSKTSGINATKNAEVSKNERPPPSEETDKRTVFVSNIGYHVESIEEKLEKAFGSCGKIDSVRVVRNHKEKPRGFAYVQFVDEAAVAKALELDRQDLEGRPMFVSPNVDKSKHPDFKVFKYNVSMERHKLFVSGLWQGTNEGRLREVFGQHGELKSVRVVTARDGRSKCRAYVEFKSASEATQAVMKTDETLIDGHTIKVAISNPPARNVKAQQQDDRELFRGGRRGRGRTQISLLPRSLPQSTKSSSSSAQLKHSDDSASPTKDANDNPVKDTKALSNKDFAKMFLKS